MHQRLFVMLLMLPPLSHNTIPVEHIDQLTVDLIPMVKPLAGSSGLSSQLLRNLPRKPIQWMLVPVGSSCPLFHRLMIVGATVQLWLPAATISWLLPWTLNLVAAYTPNLVANLLPSRDLVAFRLPAFTNQDLFSGVLSFVACPADRFCLCPQ